MMNMILTITDFDKESRYAANRTVYQCKSLCLCQCFDGQSLKTV